MPLCQAQFQAQVIKIRKPFTPKPLAPVYDLKFLIDTSVSMHPRTAQARSALLFLLACILRVPGSGLSLE